jgi:maleylpyruvate isomerase
MARTTDKEIAGQRQTGPMPSIEDLESLHHSEQRVLRTVDSLKEEQWREPSVLPGWSRAHVVAHLALNAEGFAGALTGLATGEHVAIYPSNDARDAGIEQLSTASDGIIRERLFAATQHLRDVMERVTADQWDSTVNRLPEGPVWPAAGMVEARQREVEVHHADLGVGYSHRDWPTPFAVQLLEHAAGAQSFAVTATDLDRTWSVGADEPVVSGTAADLGWWLIGRGSGDELNSAAGLPELGPWQRAR